MSIEIGAHVTKTATRTMVASHDHDVCVFAGSRIRGVLRARDNSYRDYLWRNVLYRLNNFEGAQE